MSDYPEKDRLFLLRLTEVILSNLGKENFDVSELASQSGMTRYQLLHRLQSITGKNITQFIRETRLHKALELIKQEDLTISQVSYMTGFCSPTYFNTCFSEYFGYPPGAVRKQDIADTRALTESGIAPVLVKHVKKSGPCLLNFFGRYSDTDIRESASSWRQFIWYDVFQQQEGL